MKERDDVVVIFVKSYFHRGLNRRVYAYEYGLEAFRLEIPREKYRGS